MSRFAQPWSYLDRGSAVPNSLFWVPKHAQLWVQPHPCPCSYTWLGVRVGWTWQAETSLCFCVLATFHRGNGIFLEQFLPQVLSKASVMMGGEENWPAAHPASLKSSVGHLLVVAKSRIPVLKSHCPTDFQSCNSICNRIRVFLRTGLIRRPFIGHLFNASPEASLYWFLLYTKPKSWQSLSCHWAAFSRICRGISVEF